MPAERSPVIYVATKNSGKFEEFDALLARYGARARSFEGYRDVAETDGTYAGNAALKARALRAQLLATGVAAAVLADDSGLEVAVLGGRPGVLSARYGGPAATWPQRRASLVAEAARAHARDRRAAFVCALHFITAEGTEHSAFARCEGTLLDVERGDGGFSYDAVFAADGGDRSFAELTFAEKNAVSHRASAIEQLFGQAGEVAPGDVCSSEDGT